MVPNDASHPHYDRIGTGYSDIRVPDPRLAVALADALAGARSVLNVGAGSGSYEPTDLEVVATDRSRVMLAQHPGPRRVQADALALPFRPGSFDAALATLTVHHWHDLAQGLAEMRRVSARQVVFTWDPGHPVLLWLWEEYLPELVDYERSRFSCLDHVVSAMDAHTVVPFEIPRAFTDGFQHAFWHRPEAFLDPRIRAASSMFATIGDEAVAPAMRRLRDDLQSGHWHQRHQDLTRATSVDYGFRILIAG